MKWKPYWNYFLFIARRWNVWLALFTIYHEIKGERKYRISTTGIHDLKGLQVSGEKEHAYIYQPVNYYMLEKAFNFLRKNEITGAMIDYGCGRGRILAVAAAYPFTGIAGIEFSPSLCAEAKKNLQRIPHSNGAEILIHCMNAEDYKVQSDDVVFTFFNPFDEQVMVPVVRNLLQSVKESPREIFVIYFNPTEKEIFLSAGFRELRYYRKMNYLDFSILHILPEVQD